MIITLDFIVNLGMIYQLVQGYSYVTSVMLAATPVGADRKVVRSVRPVSTTPNLALCTVCSANQEPSTTILALIPATLVPKVFIFIMMTILQIRRNNL